MKSPIDEISYEVGQWETARRLSGYPHLLEINYASLPEPWRSLLETLEKNPKKGKFLGQFAGFAIKELKYKNFRFYFIVDGYKLNILSEKELVDLLMRFVRMSDKKAQQKTIDEIREILLKIGPRGFD